MAFYKAVDQVVDLLQSRKRVAYRALKRQFDFDDDDLEALAIPPLFSTLRGPSRRRTPANKYRSRQPATINHGQFAEPLITLLNRLSV